MRDVLCHCSLIINFAIFALTVMTAPSPFAQEGIPAQETAQSTVELQLETNSPPFDDPIIVFPTPTCRAGILQFDAGLGQLGALKDLAAIGSALQRALDGEDVRLAQYIQEWLSELITADTGIMRAVLNDMGSATEVERNVFLMAIQDAAIDDSQVVDQLLNTAEKPGDAELQRRALAALQTQPSLSAVQLDRLTALGKEATGDRIAIAATSVIGLVLRNDQTRVDEYATRLLDIAQAQTDLAVAYLAVEMVGHPAVTLDTLSVQRLTNLLNNHPSLALRKLAVHVLSSARDTQTVLKVYEQAFKENMDLCVRWAIMKFSLRAVGAKALPLLAEFAALEPGLQQDAAEFRQMYDSGIVDFEHIWLAKTAKGFHRCDMGPAGF
jgi:hypothetical protein